MRGPDECWLWVASRKHGYGQITVGKKPRIATRLIYELTTGERPPSVRHTCDNPPCCNPAHLRGGTQKDNAADMLDRERQASRLTREAVLDIRQRYARGESQVKLAAEYGVAISTVAMATRGDTWDHVENERQRTTGEGLCECGCGRPAPIAKMTNTKKGHVKGQPVRFIRGHHARQHAS